MESVQKVIANVVAVPESITAIVACVVLCSWSLSTIRAKTPILQRGQEAAGIVLSSEGSLPELQYTYVRSIRALAKAALLVTLIAIPFRVRAAFIQLAPLPTTFFGYLVDSRTGEPLTATRVRVLDGGGADVTEGEWGSDSRGFYVVKTVRRVQRNAKLQVFLQECSRPNLLPLTAPFEQRPSSLQSKDVNTATPSFFHSLSCEDRK